MGFIYEIRNVVNCKRYIGQTVNDYRKRWNQHKWDLIRGTHKNKHLQASWNKYGADAFRFKVLEVVKDDGLLSEREKYYIEKYKTFKDNRRGYNMTDGGEHGIRNYIRNYYVRYNNYSGAFRVLANGGDRQIIAEFKNHNEAIELRDKLNLGKLTVEDYIRERDIERAKYKPQNKGNGVFYLRQKHKPHLSIYSSKDYDKVLYFCELINKWGFSEEEVQDIVNSIKESDKNRLRFLSQGRILYQNEVIFQSTVDFDLVKWVFGKLYFSEWDLDYIASKSNYDIRKEYEESDEQISSFKCLFNK